MAYLPLNARSEFVMPLKLGGGGVSETTRRFHLASSASIKPAPSPIQGTGLGALADMPTAGATVDSLIVELEAHAESDAAPSTTASVNSELVDGRVSERRAQYSHDIAYSSLGGLVTHER
jgi:hypothetical protein